MYPSCKANPWLSRFASTKTRFASTIPSWSESSKRVTAFLPRSSTNARVASTATIDRAWFTAMGSSNAQKLSGSTASVRKSSGQDMVWKMRVVAKGGKVADWLWSQDSSTVIIICKREGESRDEGMGEMSYSYWFLWRKMMVPGHQKVRVIIFKIKIFPRRQWVVSSTCVAHFFFSLLFYVALFWCDDHHPYSNINCKGGRWYHRYFTVDTRITVRRGHQAEDKTAHHAPQRLTWIIISLHNNKIQPWWTLVGFVAFCLPSADVTHSWPGQVPQRGLVVVDPLLLQPPSFEIPWKITMRHLQPTTTHW